MSNLPAWMDGHLPAATVRDRIRYGRITSTPDDAPAWEFLPTGERPGAYGMTLGTVDGYDVVSMAPVVNTETGHAVPGLFVVIVYRPYHGDRYAVWTCGEFRRDRLPVGAPAPRPRGGAWYGRTWSRACAVQAERASDLSMAFAR